jgi:hypothetical protein
MEDMIIHGKSDVKEFKTRPAIPNLDFPLRLPPISGQPPQWNDAYEA